MSMQPSRPSLWKLFVLLAVVFSALPAVSAAEEKPIMFGINSTAEPSRVFAEWQPFADYLAAQLKRPIKMVVPRGFEKLSEAVEQGQLDIFYANSHIYYRLKEKGKATAIAQMQNLNGNVTSRSVVLVRKDSGIKNLDQLKGEKVAFVSPMGAGGYLAPRAQFYQAGIKTKTDVQEEFTKNLSTSLHKVLLGDVKAATMCGLNYRLMSVKIETGELEIIGTSDDYAEDVVGARASLPATEREQIARVLFDMDKNEAGRRILTAMEELKIQKFIPYDAKKTETITRRLLQQAAM
jgi:phosphonate transport system substrate-binding protein